MPFEDLLKQQADIAVRMLDQLKGAMVQPARSAASRLALFAHKRYLERHGHQSTNRGIYRAPADRFDRQLRLCSRDMAKQISDIQDIRFDFRPIAKRCTTGHAFRAGWWHRHCVSRAAARDPDLVSVGCRRN